VKTRDYWLTVATSVQGAGCSGNSNFSSMVNGLSAKA